MHGAFVRPRAPARSNCARDGSPLVVATPAPPLHGWGVERREGIFPAVNVCETEQAIIVEAEASRTRRRRHRHRSHSRRSCAQGAAARDTTAGRRRWREGPRACGANAVPESSSGGCRCPWRSIRACRGDARRWRAHGDVPEGAREPARTRSPCMLPDHPLPPGVNTFPKETSPMVTTAATTAATTERPLTDQPNVDICEHGRRTDHHRRPARCPGSRHRCRVRRRRALGAGRRAGPHAAGPPAAAGIRHRRLPAGRFASAKASTPRRSRPSIAAACSRSACRGWPRSAAGRSRSGRGDTGQGVVRASLRAVHRVREPLIPVPPKKRRRTR